MHYQLYLKACRQIRGSPVAYHPALMAAPKNTACGLPQRKERGHMEKQKYQMDLSFLEDYDNNTRNYQPFDLLATPKCMPLMVMCSKKPEPAAWSIIGTMYSVHFLHYRDMEDYIIRRGLTRWTDEHDRESGLCLSGISNRCRIF